MPDCVDDRKGSATVADRYIQAAQFGSLNERLIDSDDADVKFVDWNFRFYVPCAPDQIDSDPRTLLQQSQPVSWPSEFTALQTLKDDWNGYGSLAPNDLAVQNALRVVELLQQLWRAPDRLGPSADGGVELFLSRGSRYCSIECFNDGTVVGGTSDRQGQIQTWSCSVEFGELTARIRESMDFVDG